MLSGAGAGESSGHHGSAASEYWGHTGGFGGDSGGYGHSGGFGGDSCGGGGGGSGGGGGGGGDSGGGGGGGCS